MGTTYAVLIGIETYQQRGIGSVQFAQADAAEMKDLLVQDLGVPALLMNGIGSNLRDTLLKPSKLIGSISIY